MKDRETARKKSCSSPLMNLSFSDERGEGSDGRDTHTHKERVVCQVKRYAQHREAGAHRAHREPVGLAFFFPPAQPEPTPRSVESGKVRFNVTHALWTPHVVVLDLAPGKLPTWSFLDFARSR